MFSDHVVRSVPALLVLLSILAIPAAASALQCGEAKGCVSAGECEDNSPGTVCGTGKVCSVVEVEPSFWPWAEDDICCGCVPTRAGLPTNNGDAIAGDDLRRLVDTYVPEANAHSTLVVATTCFGGDMQNEFEDRQNTGFISATSPGGSCSTYGGYSDDAADALHADEDWTSDDVHRAGIDGKADSESPFVQGDEISLEPVDPAGTIQSRHVLVYAGQPGGPDNDDVKERDRIVANFAGDPNTTVTTVGGEGAAEGWDYPGTVAGLESGLYDISVQMHPSEQFILFLGDHGLWLTPGVTPACDVDYGWFRCETVLGLPEGIHEMMLDEPDNQPEICVSGRFDHLPLTVESRHRVFEIGEDEAVPIDYVGDGDWDEHADFEACFPVDEEEIDLSGEIVIVEGAEWIDDDPPLVRLHSGAISRLVESEPEDEPETDDDDSADDDTSPDEEPGDDDNVLCGLTAGDCTFGVSLATVCPSLSLLGVYRRRHWATLR